MRSSTNLLKSSQVSRPCQTWLPPEFQGGIFSGAVSPSIQHDKCLTDLSPNGAMQDQLSSLFADQTEDILEKARSEADVIRSQAREEGLRQGQDEAAHIILQAQGILHEVQAWQEDILSQGETMVIALLLEISRKLFGEGFDLDPERVQSIVAKALSLAKPLGDLHVHVHPDDVEKIEPAWQAIKGQHNHQSLQLVPDPTIRKGGCLIEGQAGCVDARIKTQLERIANTFQTIQPGTEDPA